MGQDGDKILPQYVNTDVAYEKLNKDEAAFLKSVAVGTNANADSKEGTSNPVGEGQNVLVLTPTRSNEAISGTSLPAGYNLNCGQGYFADIQKTFYFNYNGNNNHGIYVLDGNDGSWNKVLVDPKLKFSNDPENFITEHRIRVRVRYNADKSISEIYLTWTDGNVWQGWVNFLASIRTDGFNVSLYPYWALQPPHFDREELFQYAPRPAMYKAVATLIANTTADSIKINNLLNTAFQFSYQPINTDGREAVISPFSDPLIVKTSEFLSNPDIISKNATIKLYAGSPNWECINIYVRKTIYKKGEQVSEFLTWGDWYLYDTIYKYSSCGVNDPSVIGSKYWLRTLPWADYSYDPVLNTITYKFDNSKLGQITPQDLFERYAEQPQVSVAMTDLGDSIAFANNREGYDNFPCSVTNKLSTTIETQNTNSCTLPFRKVRVYCYVGRERGSASRSDTDRDRNTWISQVGYTDGTDKTVRFGGTVVGLFSTPSYGIRANIDIDESKQFDLDFADKTGFRLYVKGTPFFADASWYQVKPDFTLTKLDAPIDRQNASDMAFLKSAYLGGSFFVGVFDLELPAGRYDLALGRHNVASAGDYRSQSTYVMGIANSRITSGSGLIKPNAIVDVSKEMEIDCTAGDVDLWGSGKDMFYICCPFNGVASGESRWTFIEGYLKESHLSSLAVEKFPYNLTYEDGAFTGNYTDKNGFFWGYTWGSSTNNNSSNIHFHAVMECAVKDFIIPINNVGSDSAWRHDNIAYASDYNGGTFGFADRIILSGRITDSTGTIGYANIGVSFVNGETVFTDNNGNYQLVIHNGFTGANFSNIYINSGGSFLITAPNCGNIPVYPYTDGAIPCQNNAPRLAPPINQSVFVQSGEYQSLKSMESLVITVHAADLAGRVTFENKISELSVPSFPARGNVLPSFLRWTLSGQLALNQSDATKDLKWIGFSVSKATNYKRYVQWVGDKIEFIDANGNVTTTPNASALVRITISSLLNANIQKNFTLLSTYQFTENDRLRIFDDGDNNLFNTATYGDVIDVEIQGSNYNQAAINANLVPPANNTVLTQNTNPVGSNPTTLYATYDSRFDKLKDKTGFWIELYTPSENNDKLPFFEINWHPVINGEIAEYVNGGILNPVYNYLQSEDLNYWDTYFIRRSINIPGVGNKFIQHIFESPNVTDSWGANLTSGGRANVIDPYARQMWYRDSLIRSDNFINNGSLNGLGTFRAENRKTFKGYQRGGITAIICQYSFIFFLCENDYFTTDYNFQYVFANAQGIQIANLDNNLGEPHQKVGNNSGCSYQDTKTILTFDKNIWWLDRKGEGWMQSNFQGADDVSDLEDKDGRKYGIKSYLTKKLQFINDWNATHDISSHIDVSAGIDTVRKNIFLTFRPRRHNSNTDYTYINQLRNIKLDAQETVVFNFSVGRWTRWEGFVPESYSRISGLSTGVEMLGFAAGKPYRFNNIANPTFLNFFGVQTEPVIIAVLNKKSEDVKILQAMRQDITGEAMFVDMVFSQQDNGFSYVPINLWKNKEKNEYAGTLRDMVTYLDPNNINTFRSTLQDGKRIFGQYFIVRFVGNPQALNNYFQLSGIEYLFTNSAPTKP